MIKEIRFSEEFDRAFKRLKKRYRSLPDDVKKLLASLIENPRQGAELYNGMRKVRISFASSILYSLIRQRHSCQQFPIPQKYPPRHPKDASALCIRHCLTTFVNDGAATPLILGGGAGVVG